MKVIIPAAGKGMRLLISYERKKEINVASGLHFDTIISCFGCSSCLCGAAFVW